MKRLVMDLDDTICRTIDGNYQQSTPVDGIAARLREYKAEGFEIVINTSRNMRTYEGNIGKINANTLPVIIDWLKLHDIPYDEIFVGKPWCGHDGFYVDDRAVRPSEFLKYSREEITDFLKKEKQ